MLLSYKIKNSEVVTVLSFPRSVAIPGCVAQAGLMQSLLEIPIPC